MGKILTMQACHNQKYTGYSKNFNAYGCAASSVAHIAEYYGEYEVSDENLEEWLINKGVITSDNFNAVWKNCPDGLICKGNYNILKDDYVSFYESVKFEIDKNDAPVIIRMGYKKGGNHFVVAYGYENKCTSDEDILVLDSVNCSSGTISKVAHPGNKNVLMKITDDSKGSKFTLKRALEYNYADFYQSYKTTGKRIVFEPEKVV